MKVLFTGLGSIGQRHLRNLRELLGDSVEILAYRVRREVPMLNDRLQVVEGGSVKDKYGVAEFDDLDKALAEKPDIVFVTNPTSMHMEVARKAAKAECHLFIEKPLGASSEGVDELIELVERKRLVVFVAYQLRFHPGLMQVSAWLKEERIGQLISANLLLGEYMPGFHPYEDYRKTYPAIKSMGGGVLLSQIHELDYALWLFGKPSRIFALGGQLSELEIDAEDAASVLMECQCNGKVLPVSLTLDFLLSPPRRTCTIVGDQGSIVWDYHGESAVLQSRVTGETETLDFSDLERNQMFMDELKHFLSAVKGEVSPIVDIRLGYDSLQMALAALASIETGEVQVLK
jgi:predicted dehydrogenase